MDNDRFAPLGDISGVQRVVPAGSSPQIKHDPDPVTIPAAAALPANIRHSRHGEPTRAWQYQDAEGKLLFAVCRFDIAPGAKEVLPFSCTAGGRWVWKAPARPRPLYGLPELATRPDAPVLVVEGEKAADAARALFPDHVAVCWQGGGEGAEEHRGHRGHRGQTPSVLSSPLWRDDGAGPEVTRQRGVT